MTMQVNFRSSSHIWLCRQKHTQSGLRYSAAAVTGFAAWLLMLSCLQISTAFAGDRSRSQSPSGLQLTTTLAYLAAPAQLLAAAATAPTTGTTAPCTITIANEPVIDLFASGERNEQIAALKALAIDIELGPNIKRKKDLIEIMQKVVATLVDERRGRRSTIDNLTGKTLQTELTAALLAAPSVVLDNAIKISGGTAAATHATESEVTTALSALADAKKAEVSRQILQDAESVEIAGRAGKASAAACTALATETNENALAAAAAKTAGDIKIDAIKKFRTDKLSGGDSKYQLLLGSVQSLEAKGDFQSAFEATFLSRTEAKDFDWGIIHWDNFESEFEATFSALGEIEEPAAMQPMNPTDPFQAGGGFFRLNISAENRQNTPAGDRKIFGTRIGIGLTTEPSDADTDVDARPRAYIGKLVHADFGTSKDKRRGSGRVFLGYAKDKFWDRPGSDESDRIVLDAQLDVPGIFSTKTVRLFGRVFADVPTSGSGPSDIRISLLLNVDLGVLIKGP